MHKYSNKNKKTSIIYLGITVIIITGFLLSFSLRISAQEVNTNLNTNTLTNGTETNTNTNINSDTSANTNVNVDANTNTSNSQLNVTPSENPAINDLTQQIDEKKKMLDELKKKTQTYQESIKIKQQEALNLRNQLALLDDQLLETSNNIQMITVEIEQLNLEIEKLIFEISQKEDELMQVKEKLSEFIRILYHYDQKTYLEIFIVNKSFSEFFDQLKYARELEKNVKTSLDEVKGLKQELENKKQEKENKRKELEDNQIKLKNDIQSLEDQKVYKGELLEITKSNEQKFEELLKQAQAEQQQANAEISTLEEKAREKLNQEGVDLNQEIKTLAWPVSSNNGISAYFHDPTYIFRKYFEHPAIDIRVSQGTEVTAAANGYVARAKNAGMGYSYVMLVHNNSISTVYGHLSQINVSEDTYVVKGQVIGLSGGIPGTAGAGRLTTGAHLHFEVRSDGIPVNPLDYLPQ